MVRNQLSSPKPLFYSNGPGTQMGEMAWPSYLVTEPGVTLQSLRFAVI